MSYRKITNVVFLLLVALLLAAPVTVKLASSAGVAFPEWVGANKASSTLEGRKYTAPPSLSLETIESGKMQSQADKFLADSIPMRDDVLLANARAARVHKGRQCSIRLPVLPHVFWVELSAFLERRFPDSASREGERSIHESTRRFR